MTTAFCIYIKTNHSLNFYKRDLVLSVDDTLENILLSYW